LPSRVQSMIRKQSGQSLQRKIADFLKAHALLAGKWPGQLS